MNFVPFWASLTRPGQCECVTKTFRHGPVRYRHLEMYIASYWRSMFCGNTTAIGRIFGRVSFIAFVECEAASGNLKGWPGEAERGK